MKRILKIVVVVLVLLAAYWLVEFALRGFNLKEHESFVIYETKNCGNYSIQLRTHVSRPYPGGESWDMRLHYIQGEQDKTLPYRQGSFSKGERGVAEEAGYPLTVFELTTDPNLDTTEGALYAKSGEDLYFMNIRVSPEAFSTAEFQEIGTCIQKNITGFNQALNEPPAVDLGNYYLVVNAVAYTETRDL